MKDYSNINDEELKGEFIKWFGEEKWEEEEILGFLQNIIFDICRDYLNIEPIPVVFEKVEGTISVLDLENLCIKVNPKYKNDKVVLAAAVVHELEHCYQLIYVSNFDTPKAKRWKEELKNYKNESDPIGNAIQEIEIDAEAFAQLVLSCEYGIEYKNENPYIQSIIDLYISSRKILEP